MNNTANITYLNTAATGLLPDEFTKEAQGFYKSLSVNASGSAEQLRENMIPRVRKAVASFLNCDADNISLLPNFSWGISAVVQSLKGSEKVMLYQEDYPSLTDPFKTNSFEIEWIVDIDGFTVDIGNLKDTIKEKSINVLAISHVQWMSGYKADIEDLATFCRSNNVTFIVDATQSMGAIPIDISAIKPDVLIASNYKWMNAGFGTGVMYISDEFLDKYPPVVLGNNSYELVDGNMQLVHPARNYEPGHINMYGFVVLEAAIKDKVKRGIQNIEAHNVNLTKSLLSALSESDIVGSADMQNRCSIVFLKDKPGLWDKLQAKNIIASQRGGNIRISMHYYTTERDVQKLIDCVSAV